MPPEVSTRRFPRPECGFFSITACHAASQRAGEHVVEEARSRGWDLLQNGELLEAAENAAFDVFVTTDRNLSYQQNLTNRKLAIVVLSKGRWTLIKARLAEVAKAVGEISTGGFREVDI